MNSCLSDGKFPVVSVDRLLWNRQREISQFIDCRPTSLGQTVRKRDTTKQLIMKRTWFFWRMQLSLMMLPVYCCGRWTTGCQTCQHRWFLRSFDLFYLRWRGRLRSKQFSKSLTLFQLPPCSALTYDVNVREHDNKLTNDEESNNNNKV